MKITKKIKGFSLMELMLASAILAFSLAGVLAGYISSLTLSGTSRSFTLATNAAQAKLEEVHNSNYDNIVVGSTIYTNVLGFNPGWAAMRLTVDDYTTDLTNIPYSDLKRIRVVVCWKDKGGRYIGEDNGNGGGVALDGQLTGEEDINDNGLLDSPVELVSFITTGQ